MPNLRPPRTRWFSGVVGLAVIASLVVLTAPTPVAVAQDLAQAQDGDLLTGPVRFEVADGGRLEVDRQLRYLDTLELHDGSGGVALINELSIDDYVAGIAEMPARWHIEALKAQAVAARTYGWYVLNNSSYDGYDICATVACQVFRGADVVLGSESGDRWREAVDATAGEVLMSDGDPILARYFSTSGGRTYANEEVFPSSGARDYLVSIPDPADEVSPYHRWTVAFTREQFDEVLSRGDRLAETVPIDQVERLGAVDDPGATIRVTGQDGVVVEVGTGELRDFISRVAPDRFPDLYPSLRDDGLGPLPSTVPTARYDVEVTDDQVILQGQGWGHGVGMGQYGARGRAEQGESYLEILDAYYNGLAPQRSPDLPERIRVGLATGAPTTIGSNAPMRISVGSDIIEEAALGTWEVTREDDGWRLSAPEGHGEPLEVSRTTVAEGLRAVADSVTVEVDVNKPVSLALQVTAADGTTVVDRSLGVVDAGRHAAVWRLDDGDGSLVAPGTFSVTLVGEDSMGQRDGTAVEVAVPIDDDGAGTGEPGTADGPSLRVLALVVALLSLAAGGLLLLRRQR